MSATGDNWIPDDVFKKVMAAAPTGRATIVRLKMMLVLLFHALDFWIVYSYIDRFDECASSLFCQIWSPRKPALNVGSSLRTYIDSECRFNSLDHMSPLPL